MALLQVLALGCMVVCSNSKVVLLLGDCLSEHHRLVPAAMGCYVVIMCNILTVMCSAGVCHRQEQSLLIKRVSDVLGKSLWHICYLRCHCNRSSSSIWNQTAVRTEKIFFSYVSTCYYRLRTHVSINACVFGGTVSSEYQRVRLIRVEAGGCMLHRVYYACITWESLCRICEFAHYPKRN